MIEFDIGIHADHFLAMSPTFGETVQRDIFVGIQGAKIAKIQPWDPANCQAKKFIRAKNQVLMPGLINGHTHLAMTLFRGLADDLPFSDWLLKFILPLEREMVDENFVRVGTELAALESIRFGTTTLCDMYFFGTTVGETLERAGLRAMIAAAVTNFPSPDNPNPNQNLFVQMQKLQERFTGHDRILPCLGPHAPYSCDDQTLKQVRDYSARTGLPISIHLSETQHEVSESFNKYGKSPVGRLKDLGVLDMKPICAHCVHISETETETFAKSGARVIYNAESNMKLGVGVAPILRFLKAGIPVGLGSDGAASNNNLGLFSEMDSAAKLQKLTHHDNSAMTAWQALKMATIGGAKALGLEEKIGSVEVGKFADLILVDLAYPHMQPVHDIASQLVYSATGLEVQTVLCHGKILMENTQMKVLDTEKAMSEAERYRGLIKSKLPS